MKKISGCILLIVLLITGVSFSEEQKATDANKIFYSANSLYEKRDYINALLEYDKLLALGLESGNLYYNIGNGFFKLGKLGYAILYYERAKRFIPNDSDLRSNLGYARSILSDEGYQPQGREALFSFLVKPFVSYDLREIGIYISIFYIFIFILTIFFILRREMRKFYISYILVFLIFLYGTAVFAIRYYDEEIVKYGVIIQKEVECKYEPIEKSTTFYKVKEGCMVQVIKDRSGWCQVKRADGKLGWVKKETIEKI